MKKYLKRNCSRCAVVLAAVSILLVSGCATASQPTAMIPAAVSVTKRHPQTVAIKVVGGSETAAMGAPKIGNEDFATALRQAIEQSRVFAGVSADPEGAYQLDVVIARLEQPLMGASMKVTLETNWTLKRRGDATPVWQKAITNTYTAGAMAAFAGVTRIRLANEGAARANIESAVKQISELDLK